MFPRHRFDALTDGLFGVAMTLLVLEVRLPDGVEPHTGGELMRLLAGLSPKFWPYVLSFAVLGVRWRELVRARPGHGEVSLRYINWGLSYLLLVTLVPFTTMVLGRFASLPPAIWLYSANLAGMAICAWRLSAALPAAERDQRGDGVVGLVVFLVSAALAVAFSFRGTPWACLAFLVNGLTPLVERIVAGRRARLA
ncbi:TMEM175 family protein [Phenylobacterium sp.]|uniref:TMEM175 family protein n=1 Tax=Phenylobacterium sp. TaxID=1871053 RepID=UPI00356AD703